MAVRKTGISPDLLIHPGETISDLLEERCIAQKELAQRAGVSEAFLSDVIRGKKDISKGLAMGLEYALGIPNSFWLNLQANYDSELLSLKEESSIQEEERTVLSNIAEVVKFLKKISLIEGRLTEAQKIIALRKIFKVSSLTGLRNLAPEGSFRLADRTTVDKDVLGAWLCLCKIQGGEHEINTSFDKDNVSSLISEIKSLMCKDNIDLQTELKNLLARYGIDFSIVHNFRGAPVHGYVCRMENGTYKMVLTIRGAFADVFWFSLFHEIGHIVNGDIAKPGSFIDVDYSKDEVREKRADSFASASLLSPQSYELFVDAKDYSIVAIKKYARMQMVPPYVVIGRLQKEKKISYSMHSGYKVRYKWAE